MNVINLDQACASALPGWDNSKLPTWPTGEMGTAVTSVNFSASCAYPAYPIHVRPSLIAGDRRIRREGA
jgi:hypothetical protein